MPASMEVAFRLMCALAIRDGLATHARWQVGAVTTTTTTTTTNIEVVDLLDDADNTVCTNACVNGDCVEPDTCACNSGWQGDVCDVPSTFGDE